VRVRPAEAEWAERGPRAGADRIPGTCASGAFVTTSSPRVLVVSGSAGHGHTMAGRAVTAALRERHPRIETSHVDCVALTSNVYKHLYRWSYLQLVDKHPMLWRRVYDSTNARTTRVGHALTMLGGRRFIRFIRRQQPDIVLCTHFLAPEILDPVIRDGGLKTELHAVITDHDTHRNWFYPRVDRYYVASDLVKARLALTYGVEEEHIHVTGIPLRSAFTTEPDPQVVRVRYGLDAQRPTVLFLSGGFHAGPMGASILGLWRDRRDVQVIAVCGRNERLRRRIARLPRPSGAVLLPLGFVSDVRDLMAVADLVVAKSGGLTTAECMAAGRPMLISGSIPGQEERNADAVIEAGAAYRALTPEEIRYRAALLLDDDDLRAGLARRARLFGRPQAAADIADLVATRVSTEDPVRGPLFHGAG